MSGLMRVAQATRSLSGATRAFSTSAVRRGGGSFDPEVEERPEVINEAIGKRKILAWGLNGDPRDYINHPSFPCQAVYFREDTDHVANVLRPKELGDWRQMTLEEKKELYRTAYQQTVIEFKNQHKNRWKIDLNYSLLMTSVCTLWMIYFYWDYYEGEEVTHAMREAYLSDCAISAPANDALGVYDPKTFEWNKVAWWDVNR